MKKPTDAMIEALRIYAAAATKAGVKNWRYQLMLDWSRAGSQKFPTEYQATHVIRNTLGPSWLESFELPEVTA